jgi:hypothetical protein
MALPRETMLSILSAASDDKLYEAMNAMGIDCGDMGDPLAGAGEGEAEGLKGWSAIDVAMPPPNKPQFLDRSKFEKQPEMPGRPEYSVPYEGADELGGLEYMPVE